MRKNKKRDTYSSFVFKSFLNKINIFKKVEFEDSPPPPPKSPYGSAENAPMHIAFIVDGVVEDIVHCDERFGYLLISSPTVVKLDSFDSAKINDKYNEETNSFKNSSEV